MSEFDNSLLLPVDSDDESSYCLSTALLFSHLSIQLTRPLV